FVRTKTCGALQSIVSQPLPRRPVYLCNMGSTRPSSAERHFRSGRQDQLVVHRKSVRCCRPSDLTTTECYGAASPENTNVQLLPTSSTLICRCVLDRVPVTVHVKLFPGLTNPVKLSAGPERVAIRPSLKNGSVGATMDAFAACPLLTEYDAVA